MVENEDLRVSFVGVRGDNLIDKLKDIKVILKGKGS